MNSPKTIQLKKKPLNQSIFVLFRTCVTVKDWKTWKKLHCNIYWWIYKKFLPKSTLEEQKDWLRNRGVAISVTEVTAETEMTAATKWKLHSWLLRSWPTMELKESRKLLHQFRSMCDQPSDILGCQSSVVGCANTAEIAMPRNSIIKIWVWE